MNVQHTSVICEPLVALLEAAKPAATKLPMGYLLSQSISSAQHFRSEAIQQQHVPGLPGCEAINNRPVKLHPIDDTLVLWCCLGTAMCNVGNSDLAPGLTTNERDVLVTIAGKLKAELTKQYRESTKTSPTSRIYEALRNNH